MRNKQLGYGFCTIVLCGILSWGNPVEARAAHYGIISGPGFNSGDYIAAIEDGVHPVYVSMGSDDILQEACQGDTYTIVSDRGEGWLEIQAGDSVGYLSVGEGVSVVEKAELEASETEDMEEAAVSEELQQEDISDSRRQELVDFALQFLGGKYRAGGNDPHSGVDCSGFTSYVMLHGAGVSVNRSSGGQAQQGVAVTADQMRPGDLVFYGSGSRINHVAMYIGDGQVVHASTYKTGIKLSPWNYRTPVAIRNVLGD